MSLKKMTWDELNELVGYKVSEPIDDYYNPMQISRARKQRRISLAKELYKTFVSLLVEIFYSKQLDADIAHDIFERTREEYMDIVSEFTEVDDYLIEHCIETISNTISVLERHSDEPYYYSDDRAIAISENDANSILNYSEFEDALGRYSYKTWNTIMDGRERDSHAELNGTTIPINELFEARGGLMSFPRDTQYDASDEEIVGCRCSLSYS